MVAKSEFRDVVDHGIAEHDERIGRQRFGKCISDHVLGVPGDVFEGVPMLILEEAQGSSVMPGTVERLELMSSHDSTCGVVFVDGDRFIESDA